MLRVGVYFSSFTFSLACVEFTDSKKSSAVNRVDSRVSPVRWQRACQVQRLDGNLIKLVADTGFAGASLDEGLTVHLLRGPKSEHQMLSFYYVSTVRYISGYRTKEGLRRKEYSV